jgi:hypothetical protein
LDAGRNGMPAEGGIGPVGMAVLVDHDQPGRP